MAARRPAPSINIVRNPRFGSVAAKAIEWLTANPDECLSVADVATKFGACSTSDVEHLRLAVSHRVLTRVRLVGVDRGRGQPAYLYAAPQQPEAT